MNTIIWRSQDPCQKKFGPMNINRSVVKNLQPQWTYQKFVSFYVNSRFHNFAKWIAIFFKFFDDVHLILETFPDIASKKNSVQTVWNDRRSGTIEKTNFQNVIIVKNKEKIWLCFNTFLPNVLESAILGAFFQRFLANPEIDPWAGGRPYYAGPKFWSALVTMHSLVERNAKWRLTKKKKFPLFFKYKILEPTLEKVVAPVTKNFEK